MIKCEVIKEFTLGESDEFRFEDLKNIQRRRLDTKGKLYYGDTFECTKEMADYLMGDNKDKKVVVKVIEIEPETINKDNVLEKLNESLEKLEKEELIETIPVINKNGIIVDRVVKDKLTKKKKSSKK